MNGNSPWLRRALTWAHLWPAFRSGLWVVALFGVGIWLARQYAIPIGEVLAEHPAAGIVVFVGSSALAVILPLASNLPLVALAVLAWGPVWTALLLLLGWMAGSIISFMLARWARHSILRRFPSVRRHADIDRLIHPRHRLVSLISLRMTFPVDVLSYALGLFSRQTTLAELTLSTTLGAAPFAFLFAWFPTLSGTAQWVVFGGSAAVFFVHLWWVLHETGPGGAQA